MTRTLEEIKARTNGQKTVSVVTARQMADEAHALGQSERAEEVERLTRELEEANATIAETIRRADALTKDYLQRAESARKIGRDLKASMPKGVGFAVLVFDFGGQGNLAYVSNADRADMVKAMKEFIANVERDQVPSVFEGPRS